MKKREIITVLIIVAVIIAVIFLIMSFSKSQVCFRSHCFNVEIADTPELREKGLMYVKSLSENDGMLFIFPESGKHSFWMKNTLIPLDIIWINVDKEIVFIKGNVQPCLASEVCVGIVPNQDAKYVLELKAGSVDRIGLQGGDVLSFKGVKDVAAGESAITAVNGSQ